MAHSKAQTFPPSIIRNIDHKAIHEWGIPGQLLMENAGAAVARETLSLLHECENKRVGILCGLGNNGGDGFVAARHLANPEIDLKVFLLGSAEKLQGDSLWHFDLLKKCPVIVEEISSSEPIRRFGSGGEMVWVDSIFGTGLTREVDGFFGETVDFINSLHHPVLAVDIPSGLDGETGQVLGTAIRARKTITFVRPKTGFVQNEGPQHTGEVTISPIGIPETLVQQWINENE